jgi:hypothetical protein
VTTPEAEAVEVQFNVNELVRVRLTEYGRKVLREQHDELRRTFPNLSAYAEPRTDADGFTSFQLWSLMESLGPYCGLACPLPFETTIRLTVTPPKEADRE